MFSKAISITLPTDGPCPALPDFTNGVISYSTGGPDEFPDSTIATYSCNEGYFLEGEPDRTCRVPAGTLDGTYDGEEPYCVRKSQSKSLFIAFTSAIQYNVILKFGCT